MLCPSCFEDKPAQAVCPHCGFDESAARPASLLPYRQRLRHGRYVLGVVLGKPGGFGVAYKALDRKFGAVVVVKELLLTDSGQAGRDEGSPRVQVNPGFEAEYRKWILRFIDEACCISRFRNPAIVRVSEVFEENNTAYYAMPFVEGVDLGEYRRAKGDRLSPQEVSRLALKLLPALAEIHAAGVVHRDIKPSNILVTSTQGRPVLIDFGAARDHFDDEKSRSHMAVHTPAYSPPEQWRMQNTQGPWTDIYALCATLYHCLVGKTPPHAKDRCDPRARHDPYAPIRSSLPQLDRRLAELIDSGLRLDHERRPQSARDAARVLGVDLPDPPSLARTDGAPSTGSSSGAAEQTQGPRDDDDDDAPDLSLARGGLAALLDALATAWKGMGGNDTSASGPASVPTDPDLPTDETVSAVEIQLYEEGAAPVSREIRPSQSLVIGRTSPADLIIRNDLVSARHVKLSVSGQGEFRLEDLGSTNHTFQYQRGSNGQPGQWKRVRSARGLKGRFMLGPVDGGVLLDIVQIRVRP